MEVQTQLQNNPYEMVMVKRENASSPSGEIKNPCEYAYTPQDVIFGNFQLQSSFCAPVNNNNSELLNHNHSKLNQNGRALAADRKRPYPCNLCPSRFGSKMELEEHQNSHTGQKPFQCDVCQARFNRRSTLWNHKRIHSDAKPFVCNVCSMQFKWKNSLKCHREMHSRKNETSSHMDNDLRQLTYATAAKRKLMMEEQGNPATSSAISSQPLITTSTSKKNTKKVLFKSSPSSTSSLASSLHAVQPLQASSLIPPSDHHLDLDTSSLDTLVQSNSSLLMQLYGNHCNDMDTSNLPRQSMLSALDENNMLGTQLISDVKPEVFVVKQVIP
ncbi:hypothetical protein WR25_09521 isoform A [Diploscapter pachys]|uniref:C2H2-type domain-containing protein n=1 Tax=Diploscapter pachys TaxID=2018661 RepID=A0A2A2J3J3_9BILA|nr:hypothetical protein WR25_09521 isoform A [Diploscapter pachys]